MGVVEQEMGYKELVVKDKDSLDFSRTSRHVVLVEVVLVVVVA